MPAAAVPSPHGGARPSARLFVKSFPKAAALCLLLIALAEMAVRLIPVERLIWRGTTNTSVHTDTGQAAAMAMIDIRGSADVALVGSSMMREAVNVPRMADSLRKQAKRRLSVGDYSVRGARAEEISQITHELLASKRLPKLLMVGLSLRDLQTDHRRLSALSQYWTLRDWTQAARAESFAAVRPCFSTAIYNTLARHCRLLRFRETLRELVLHPRTLAPADTNPITGHPGQNLRSYVADGQVTVKALRKQLAKEYKTNDLHPDQRAIAALEHLLIEARARSPGTKVVLFELPIPTVTRKALPKAEYNEFLQLSRELASAHHVPFLTLADFQALSFKPKDGYFLDSQHMNHYGNTRFADTLATIAAQQLK